jgi:Rps23 Pro-64 3,4-dihydroxylase Tpa1-like proline 4-hydroxylase
MFLLNDARDRLKNGTEFNRSNFHWKPAIRLSSAVVLVRDYEPHLSQLILADLKGSGIVDHTDYHVMNYAWTKLSYIPWHDDDQRSEALTIYLNDRWELDWGGLFLYEDEDQQIRAFAPRFNCGLRNGANVSHSTTPVTLEAPEPRFTLQLFSK